MPTKKKLNKSAAIREILNESPNATPREIIARITKDHGIELTPQYVSTIKCNSRKAAASQVSTEFEHLLEAKRFVAIAGGVEQAIRLIRDYNSLCGAEPHSPRS